MPVQAMTPFLIPCYINTHAYTHTLTHKLPQESVSPKDEFCTPKENPEKELCPGLTILPGTFDPRVPGRD